MDQKEVKRYLNVIKRAVSYLEAMLDCEDGGLLEQMTASVTPQIQQAVVPQPVLPQPIANPEPPLVSAEEMQRQEMARKKHVGDLMAIDCWPEAVAAFLLAKAVTPQENKQRATSVFDFLLDRNIEGLNFLDFGCGEGWTTKEALSRGVAESVGYDIKESDNWKNLNNVTFITSLEHVKNNHFDIVMLYDVLDHCHEPLEVMSQVKRCLKRDGTVYVRCHPWTAKHAMHLHKNGINKAYIHLFLHLHELKELIGEEPQFTRKEMNPIEAYRWWFKDFEIRKEKSVEESVNGFFYVDSFKELLANEHGINDIDGFLKLMRIQFIDYCLKVK